MRPTVRSAECFALMETLSGTSYRMCSEMPCSCDKSRVSYSSSRSSCGCKWTSRPDFFDFGATTGPVSSVCTRHTDDAQR